MRRLILMASTLVLLAGLLATPVLATPNTKLMFIQDVAPGGSSSDADMIGPEGFGFINYNQNANSELRLNVVLKNAEAETEYTIYLTAGPTHATAQGFIAVGTLTTNIQGNGEVLIWVDLLTLQSAPFGSGERTDHIDLLGTGYPATSGAYVVSVLEYSVP